MHLSPVIRNLPTENCPYRIRLMEHTAFVEQGEEAAYQKHFFVHIGNSLSYSDPLLEVGKGFPVH